MFATPGPLPDGGQWRYEVHWAGLRVLAEATQGNLRLTTRDERDVTRLFPEFVGLAGRMRDGVLDGEIIVLHGGVPSAQLLAMRMRGEPARQAALMVFDVLRLYGVPLLHRTLDERRATLERLRLDGCPQVALSPVYDDGVALLTAARRHRLRGVVAKRADSPYRPGVRDPAWVSAPA
jgi:bifunctional non-homologous end joining protein LigD